MAFSSYKKGSAAVESALVYPLIILFVSLAISTSFKLNKEVYNNAKTNIESVNQKQEEGNLDICNLMRGRWLLE